MSGKTDQQQDQPGNGAPKKKVDIPERAARYLARMMEGVDRFDEGLDTVVANLKPRVKELWRELRLKKTVHEPLSKQIGGGDVTQILSAIAANPDAVRVINEMAEEQRD